MLPARGSRPKADSTRGQTAVEINPQQRRRVVRGAPGCFRHHTRKTQRCQIQLVDEGVDNSDRIVFGHVVVKTVREQCYLPTVTTFDTSGHPNTQELTRVSLKHV